MANRAVAALKRMVTSAAAVFRPKMLTPASLSPVYSVSNHGWFTVFDSTPGAWQRDEPPVNTDRALQNWAVYACLDLIAGDLGKLWLRLVELDDDGIWNEARSAAFSPVLKKPNGYQTRQQFIESWIFSKLGPCGNAYILKERDNRGIVVQMHVLDPWRVTPLIAPNGTVFYRLGEDYLATVTEEMMAVPASEIIHDRAACLFHPLIGVSPLYASALAAQQGLSIQRNSDQFFANRSMPGGVLTAPTEISDATLENIKAEWNSRYTGANAGKTAVLENGMKYEPFAANARDSQVTEQLNMTAKAICSAYHVPPFKIGIETLPAGQKVEDMNRIYYADCLQRLIEAIEVLLDEGLGLDMAGKRYGTEFNVDDLLRMDSAALLSSVGQGVKDMVLSPDEARKKVNLPKVKGGAEPLSQQQNWPLSILAQRAPPADQPVAVQPKPVPENDDDEETDAVEAEMMALAKNLPQLMAKAA